MSRTWVRLLAAAVALVLVATGAAVAIIRGSAGLSGQGARPERNTTLVTGWQIRDSAAVRDPGETISQPGYATDGWLAVGPRSTVLAGLVAAGRYPDIFHSTNLAQVDGEPFGRPWWYRTSIPVERVEAHAVLHLAGVVYRADAWLNGRQIATSATLIGAHNAVDVDVTGLVRSGVNTLALKIYPGEAPTDFTTVWNDWNPWPPDNNLGVWQDITLTQTGGVALSGARVTTALDLPGLRSAGVTVTVDAANTTDAPITTRIDGHIDADEHSDADGNSDAIGWTTTLTLAARERRTVTFSPANTPALRLTNPRVWWPNPLGDQPLYDLRLTAAVGTNRSDTVAATFGIRDVQSSLDADGARVFRVNGRPLLIRGGGWASDLFLRTDVDRLTQQLRLVRGLGLNAIRLEGMLESDEFYDLADRFGLLVLPGWTCCSKWEGYVTTTGFGRPWTATDYDIAEASMLAVAKRLRNHPSVIAFLIGSDFAPPGDVEARYLRALRSASWPNPVLSSASAVRSPQLGSSGLKMVGPYQWVPPTYWYGDRLGAAYGFASEISAGPNVPRLDSLQRMLTPAEVERLWREPAEPQYHAGAVSPFNNLALYNQALFARYGRPADTATYLRAAQLANYEAIRAQFEAYVARMDRAGQATTGMIYWMLNNAWPSLIWHLYDWTLAPDAGTYATREANLPLHVLWQYDTGAVTLANHRADDVSGLSVTASVYGLDGARHFTRSATGLSVRSTHTAPVFTVPAPDDLDGTYLVKLTLQDGAGRELDRNVYWWSTDPDTVDWRHSSWYHTPVSHFADMSDLLALPSVGVTATAARSGDATVTVTLANPATAGPPAFFVEASLRAADGRLLAPVAWSDNAVTLWPGESLTLTATIAGAPPARVDVAGVNVAAATIPIR